MVVKHKVELIAIPDSAALGGAMMAAWVCGNVPLDQLNRQFAGASETIHPNQAHRQAYDECTRRYGEFIKTV